MNCRAVRKARYLSPFPWITRTPIIHPCHCCWSLISRSINSFQMRPFFPPKNLAIIPRNIQTHSDSFKSLSGKCSYFIFQTVVVYFLNSPIINLPDCFVTWTSFYTSLPFYHPSCIFAHLLLPANLVVVVQWSGSSICSQLSTYIDLCHCVYALDQLLFTIHEIPAKKKKKKKNNDKALAQCCRMSINPDEKSRQLFSNQHILF